MYNETVESYGEENPSDYLLDTMQRKIDSGNYDIQENLTALSVHKVNGEIKIQMNTSLANALPGGMNEYLESLTGGE